MLKLFSLHFTEVKRRLLSACRRQIAPETLVLLPNFLYRLFRGLIFITFQAHIVTVFARRVSRNNHFSLKAGKKSLRGKVWTTGVFWVSSGVMSGFSTQSCPPVYSPVHHARLLFNILNTWRELRKEVIIGVCFLKLDWWISILIKLFSREPPKSTQVFFKY